MAEKKTNEEILAALEAPFPPEQVRERIGHGGTKLSWVPARLVAQRLDQVLGVAGWDLYVHPVGDSNTVAATLTLHFPDGRSTTRMDFGYETGGSGESLKEASSDALRRVASLFGVARALYAGDMPRPQVSGYAPKPKLKGVNAVRETRYQGSDPASSVFDPESDDAKILKAAMSFAQSVGESNCPDHDIPWSYKPAGTSRAGKPYAGFWSCKVRDENGWCQKKPSIKWIAEQPIPEAAPVPMVPADNLTDILPDLKPSASDLGEELPF
jgi:hypothetical protein